MLTVTDVESWRGREVRGRDGNEIGEVEDIYLDRETGQPEWLAVRGGLFGSRTRLVPIGDAVLADEEVRVAETADRVKDAPDVELDGVVSPEQERELYEHYGLVVETVGVLGRLRPM